VLHQHLRDAWSVRKRTVPIRPVLHFSPDGLVLGAATILLPAVGYRRLAKVEGAEARLLALLSATFGRAIAPSVLGNIERATKSWRDGDVCLAAIHLAHAGLAQPDDPHEAARRLFITDAFIKAGTSPFAILRALGLDNSYLEAVEKLYNPFEPRVPAGNGILSGRWTAIGSFLAELTATQLARLGVWGLVQLGVEAAGAVAVAGVLVFPSPNRIRVEGDIKGLPGGRYWWNRDEAQLHLTYETADGEQRTFTAWRHEDKVVDQNGRVVGRVLADDTIVVDAAAVSPDLVKGDEPRLCPAPGPDKPGGEKGRAYEDFVKLVVNPPPYTTPTGIGFQLANPEAGGKLVYYDDCQHTTGTMVEAKGPVYAKLLTYELGQKSLTEEWLDQSGRQLAAAGSRRVRWYFAEPEAAEFAGKLFRDARGGRDKIEIVVLAFPRSDR
jgi:hypothetical protein